MRSRCRGLTLMELLVATAVFALVGVMAYGGLFSVLEARASAQREAERIADVQYAIFQLVEDLRQTVDRPVRSAIPAERAALFTPSEVERVLVLTRGGYGNPAEQPRSSLVRVRWEIDGDRLTRAMQVRPDALAAQDVRHRVLLEELEAVELRFLDRNGEWQERWPPLNARPDTPGLPRAVEATLVLADWGSVTRLVPLIGGEPAFDDELDPEEAQ